MAASKEVAKATSTAVDALTDAEQNIIASQAAQFDDGDIQAPILKVGQSLTREVQDGNAEAGEFINSLTGEGIGDAIGFIVSFYQKGRSAADRKTNRFYTAYGDTIPAHWADLVGDEFVGTRFDEYPDAEEQYKVRVNNKEIEWGKGPLVSTTHNYTGLAIVSAPEGSDEDAELQPVRLSLSRVQMEAVRKINTLYRMTMRNRPFWDKVFELTTYRKSFGGGNAFIVKPTVGRDTTTEERIEASLLAQATEGGRVQAKGDESGDAPVAPKDTGGLAI